MEYTTIGGTALRNNGVCCGGGDGMIIGIRYEDSDHIKPEKSKFIGQQIASSRPTPSSPTPDPAPPHSGRFLRPLGSYQRPRRFSSADAP
ncbi:hypothetical protein BC938DRAFT_482426 [Jimgerdemannia flammicorona]|uniref:Uncharacterized protein n=1 Tax=Jimgerdemannia flammicorona TaxID=994334 RepID=A0A433QE52_9FUNG|nr:hypothetical protein BC938DRAFT_482426 [Jimgerdemannia flammicorona]